MLQRTNLSLVGCLFPCNEHGHPVVTFRGHHFSGSEDVMWLSRVEGLEVEGCASVMLRGESPEGYLKYHSLEEGLHHIALISDSAVKRACYGECSPRSVLAYAAACGYDHAKPRAGMVLRLSEILTGEHMEALGVWFLTALHRPLAGHLGHPSLLKLSRGYGRRRLDGHWMPPGSEAERFAGAWAFAFPTTMQ